MQYHYFGFIRGRQFSTCMMRTCVCECVFMCYDVDPFPTSELGPRFIAYRGENVRHFLFPLLLKVTLQCDVYL